MQIGRMESSGCSDLFSRNDNGCQKGRFKAFNFCLSLIIFWIDIFTCLFNNGNKTNIRGTIFMYMM